MGVSSSPPAVKLPGGIPTKRAPMTPKPEPGHALSDPHTTDTVYLYAADTRGHTADARAKIPPWVETLIQNAVSSPATPYTNSAQLIRDALIHRVIYWRDRLEDDAPPSWEIGIARARMEDQRRQERDADEFISMCQADFDRLRQDNPEWFRHVLTMTLQTAPATHRDRVRNLLDRLG